MAIFKLDYYKGKDLYSDGDVENELLAIAKSGVRPEEQGDVAFPVLYHFARARENILSWYPFAPGASCLEIGSGCGAITGLLCRRMERVISNELSKRRAEINYERHKGYDNLEIWVGNLNDMDFGGQFDYVILNGVFEYAESFTPGNDPYGTFLKNVRRFLKPDGVILVAIENRLGLKYFAGAPEDHTDGYFDGIKGYEESSGARTFSRGEWEALMARCGLAHYKFYYPYPDYKFPQEIFTDASLREQKYGRPTWNFTKYRMELFGETKMAATLTEEGVMDRFANSFLIEMSAADLRGRHGESEIQYVKLSTDRADEFSIATIIEERETKQNLSGVSVSENIRAEDARPILESSRAGDRRPVKGNKRVAIKRPMTDAAKGHVQKMLAQMDGDYGCWQPLRGTAEGDGIVYPYLTQKSLAQQAADAIREGDLAAVKALVKQAAALYEECTKSSVNFEKTDENREDISGTTKAINTDNDNISEIFGNTGRTSDMTADERARFREVFGPREFSADVACVCPANIDLILDNIFEIDGKYQVIDCEWIFDFPVPTPFLLWRAINELYSSQPVLHQLCEKAEFMAEFGISAEMDEVFWAWSTHFAEQYVGANRLLNHSTPELWVSLEEFRRKLREKEYMVSQLFVDTGEGFSEEQKLVEEAKLEDGKFSVAFDLSAYQNVRAVRFDPLEGRPCVCRINAAQTTGKLQAENAAASVPEGDLFLTVDPIYQVKLNPVPERIAVCGEIAILSVEEALERANAILSRIHRKLPFLRMSP